MSLTQIRHRTLAALERAEAATPFEAYRAHMLRRAYAKFSRRCQALTLSLERCRNLADPLTRACPTHHRKPPVGWVADEPRPSPELSDGEADAITRVMGGGL